MNRLSLSDTIWSIGVAIGTKRNSRRFPIISANKPSSEDNRKAEDLTWFTVMISRLNERYVVSVARTWRKLEDGDAQWSFILISPTGTAIGYI
jgi:hypothetical protein